jgi:hypothetical protein
MVMTVPDIFRRSAFVLLLIAGACSGGALLERDETTEPAVSASAALTAGTQLVDDFANARRDDYTIERAEVRGDSLVVTLRHGGGCRTHEFTLLVKRGFRESYPVQTDALIAHDAKGDSCRALLTRELSFPLHPLRELYRQNYQTSHGAIRFGLAAPGSGGVEYRF